MKIVATDIPKTIEDYQIALNAAFEGGKAYGAAIEREAIAEKLLTLGALEDGDFIIAIRARGEK